MKRPERVVLEGRHVKIVPLDAEAILQKAKALQRSHVR